MPHTEDDHDQWDGRETDCNREWNVHMRFNNKKKYCVVCVHVCVCVSVAFFGGKSHRSPRLCVYPDRRTDIWSPHEPQAPVSDTH